MLIAAADAVEFDLAESLLREAGIPCVGLGGDFDIAELGTAVHDAIRRRDLFVPAELLERARAVLGEAWGRPGGVPLAPGELEREAERGAPDGPS